MSRHERHETHCVLLMLAAVLGAGRAAAQIITEIIDATGDGAGNAYVTGNDVEQEGDEK